MLGRAWPTAAPTAAVAALGRPGCRAAVRSRPRRPASSSASSAATSPVPTSVRLIAAELAQAGGKLELTFGDGSTSAYDGVWLRDNCPSTRCAAPKATFPFRSVSAVSHVGHTNLCVGGGN